MTLKAEEFVRRFLLHVLQKGAFFFLSLDLTGQSIDPKNLYVGVGRKVKIFDADQPMLGFGSG